MVKKSEENVEIIAQKIFLELGHLNVHDLFKKNIRDNFTADEIDKASLLFCIFYFIPFTIVGNFIYLLNS